MPAATARPLGRKQLEPKVGPPKRTKQHFVIKSSGEDGCFWSEPAFRDSYFDVFDQVMPDDLVLIDLSAKDEQLDKKSLSGLEHIVFDLKEEKEAKIGLVLNDKDRAKLIEMNMDGFFTIFSLGKSFRCTLSVQPSLFSSTNAG